MKKIIIFVLVLSLITSLVGCRKSKNKRFDDFSEIDSHTVSYPFYTVTSPIRTDITVEDIKYIQKGMPFEEVVEILGAPHKYDALETRQIYKLLNDTEILILYKNGAVKMVIYPHYRVTSPVYTDLTMKDINKLYVGMPFEEAIQILGAPHRYVGSGFVAEVYKLADGSEISVYYVGGAIDCVCTEPKSGLPEIIVG